MIESPAMTGEYMAPPRKLPITANVDVLIAGGGPAGIGAAIGAAKAKAGRILLLEHANALGGMATMGMMSHWAGCTGGSELRSIQERMLKLLDCGIGNPESLNTIHHEALKSVLLEYLSELGVELQFNTLVADAVVENGCVKGVVTESKSGREVVMSRVVIDCTGDGDVAARAGAVFTLGRTEDHVCQPMTLMFRIGGVDYSRAIFPPSFETTVKVPDGEIQFLGHKNLPFPAGHVLLYKTWLPGEVCVNMTNAIHTDGTDVRELSRAEITCRRQIPSIIAFLRKYAPGYEKCYWVTSASNVGVRETRHFKTLQKLSSEDIVEGRLFPNWISTGNAFNFDIHHLNGSGLDPNGAQKNFRMKGRYSIPAGCCIPEKTDGILLAGRCIGGSHKAHSNFRAMPICFGIGQGTGVMAAEAIRCSCSVRDVDIVAVQQELIRQGIPDRN